MNKLNNYLELLKSEQEIFLNFIKAKFPIFHNSNFFFRDLQFGIRSYFEKKGFGVSYADSEEVAVRYSQYLEASGIFVKIAEKTWKVVLPEFVTTVPGDPL